MERRDEGTSCIWGASSTTPSTWPGTTTWRPSKNSPRQAACSSSTRRITSQPLVSAPKESEQREHFMAIRKIALKADRLLLLSATPLLHNERRSRRWCTFSTRSSIRWATSSRSAKRVERWQHVAELFHVFTRDRGRELSGEQPRSFAGDVPGRRSARGARQAVESRFLDDEQPLDDPERVGLIRAIRAHLSETYKLQSALLRNRRGQEQTEALLPGRVGLAPVRL